MADPTIIIDAEPDWRELPEVAYSFDTAVQITPRFVEQRRPLVNSPVRSVTCKFALDAHKAENLLNVLLSAAPQLCCVPIYSEPLFASTITQGALSITIDTDLTYLWNIQNCSYLILLDYITGNSEMLLVSSVSGQEVSLSAAIVGAWTAAQMVIYPAMASVLTTLNEVAQSSTHRIFETAFLEIVAGEEATKEWVGLEDQVCPPDIAPIPLWIDLSFLDFTEDDLGGDITLSVDTANIARTSGDFTDCWIEKTFSESGNYSFRFTVVVNSIGTMLNSSRVLRLLNFLFSEGGTPYTVALFYFDDGPSTYDYAIGINSEVASQHYSTATLTRYIEVVQDKAASSVTINIYTDSSFTVLEFSDTLINAVFSADVAKIEMLDAYNATGIAFTISVENLQYRVID